ncbi:MAG TPA: ABC transporter ATP-binding protein [Candidatus Baltobacteraceae bacterium]|nr:ABC transporter ATP-binding protein [Candidatus Baltobacteraceae bacterium]
MLEVTELDVAYGEVPALRGVSLTVADSECVSVIGANGAGKSTLLRAISGLLRPRRGAIHFAGQPLDRMPPYDIAGLGIAHVPEGRRVLPDLTVEENLELGAYLPGPKQRRRETLAWIYEIFPRLLERRRQRAGTLSGGEQQMLAIGRGLMLRPRLLMLDEPSLGLAPIIVDATFEKIAQVRKEGIGILLVEQNVQRAMGLADRAYVLEGGRVVLSGSSRDVLNDPHVKVAYLGL